MELYLPLLLHDDGGFAVVVVALPDLDPLIAFLLIQSDGPRVGGAHGEPDARGSELGLAGAQQLAADATPAVLRIDADGRDPAEAVGVVHITRDKTDHAPVLDRL